VLVPKLRTEAMIKAAGSDIQHLSMALFEYREDRGAFPAKPYTPANPDTPTQGDYMDYVLFKSLTDPDYPAAGQGWGQARSDSEFIRGDSKARNQFVDPWGTPYYYIPASCYLLGVRINDPTDSTPEQDASTGKALPNYYGTTPVWDDFKTGDAQHKYPKETLYGPPALLNAFFNPTTFQIHSKGPDQKTDYYSDRTFSAAEQAIIDACDRGQDPDDQNNFGGGK
jgi:hypothetical protein